MCDHPGQDINCVIDDLAPVSADAAAAAEAEKKSNEGHSLRMEWFSEILEEINHERLKKQFTREFNPLRKPADVTLMKEIYGTTYTPETLESVYKEFSEANAAAGVTVDVTINGGGGVMDET